MSFFGVGTNPFSSPVGQKIEQATSETLASEDWSLNMEICDMIGQLEEGPKDAMKALKKRLTMQPKNYTVIMYTLTVLETCVKNCGRRMHLLACSKDFVQELVKLIGPKNDPPAIVQEKVLTLIQSWAETFRHQPDLAGVSQMYADLKHKGVLFPLCDLEATAPIITPQRTVNPIPAPVAPVQPNPVPAPQEGQIPVLCPKNRAKLQNELELVEANAKVLSEMLNEAKIEHGESEDLLLLQDLHSTCRAMQDRVVDLVGRIDDDLLTDLLRVNDDLNAVFTRYDEFMKNINSNKQGATTTQTSMVLPLPNQQPDTQLIDLGDDDAPSQPMAALKLSPKLEDVDFDVFAQSRKSVDLEKPSSTESTDQMATAEDQRPSDFDEMEHWLREEKKEEARNAVAAAADGISSSDFDRFLAERAAAADTLPAATSPGSNQQRSRNLVKDDQTDKPQFSL